MSEIESRLAKITRKSSSVIGLEVPCKMHGRHAVVIVSEDDAAEVFAKFIAQYVFVNGYSGLYHIASEWDEVPF